MVPSRGPAGAVVAASRLPVPRWRSLLLQCLLFRFVVLPFVVFVQFLVLLVLVEVAGAAFGLVGPDESLPVRQVVGQRQTHHGGNGQAEQWDDGLYGGGNGRAHQRTDHDGEQRDPQLEGHEGRHDGQDIARKGTH
jgi:hypothetical protein